MQRVRRAFKKRRYGVAKSYLTINVYEAAIQRLKYLYNNFNPREIYLSFSGGKDSTACYHLAKEICRSGRAPF
jgi:predicted phosphoadenosine phosphosulfate sulfurtransferase